MNKNYEKAKEIIEENVELGDFVGEISEDVIKKAEGLLDIKFPKSYKQFIKDYGAGNFGSEEIYGILNENFENSGIPDAVWLTLNQRKEAKLSHNLLIIYFTGGEEYFCLDSGKMNDKMEYPVVSYIIGNETIDKELEIISNDFSEFFLNIVQREIEG